MPRSIQVAVVSMLMRIHTSAQTDDEGDTSRATWSEVLHRSLVNIKILARQTVNFCDKMNTTDTADIVAY